MRKWLLRAVLYGIPPPWTVLSKQVKPVAEYGRQPWAIGWGSVADSRGEPSPTVGDLLLSMFLICGSVYPAPGGRIVLMFKFARLGPSSLKTGRYHFESSPP